MVTELNRLAALIELDSVPLWLRQQIAANLQEIQRKLEIDGIVVLTGPTGEQVTITTKQKVAAVA
jgi:hypothetical protein